MARKINISCGITKVNNLYHAIIITQDERKLEVLSQLEFSNSSIKSFKQKLKHHKVDQLIFGVDPQMISHQTITLDSTFNEQQIETYLQQQTPALFPGITDALQFDFARITKNKNTQHCFICATRQKTLIEQTKTLIHHGINLDIVDVTSFAICRAINHLKQTQDDYLILNFCHDDIELILRTSDIATTYQLKSKTCSKAIAAELCNQLNLHPTFTPTHIYLTGHCDNHAELAFNIQANTQIRTTIFKNSELKLEPAWITCFGLALRNLI